MQLAGKERAGGAAFRDDGEAVELHQVLVDEHAVAFVDLAVAIDEFADAHAEAFELAVDVRREGGEDPRQVELPVRIEGEYLGPVHGQQIGHERGIIVQDHGIGIGELLAEDVLVHARQAGGQGLHVAGKDLVLQRAAGAVGFHDDGVQFVELEGLGKIVQLAGKSHHGEARQVLVFEHVVVERGQKFAAFHQRVVLVLLIGLDQTEADMHGIEKALEFVKTRDDDRLGCRIGILPVKAVLAEDLLPLDHVQPYPILRKE